MTLAQYIGSRREFDNMSVQQVWKALLRRGKIKANTPLREVWDACIEAKRLANLYLA
jgi:hypothetical protein